MIYFCIDPSLSCTGYAVLRDGDETKLVAAGRVRLDDDDPRTPMQRSRAIASELQEEISKIAGIEIFQVLIETPSQFSFGRGPRSTAHLPSYGLCVGVIGERFLAAVGESRFHEISVSKWAMGSKVKGDKDKTMRVLAVEQKFKLKPGALGVKSDAGNLADAVMMGMWWINQQRLIAAGGTDAGIDTDRRARHKNLRRKRKAARNHQDQ